MLLQVIDESTGITLHAKIWRKSAEFTANIVGKYIYLAFSPLISMYNGMSSVELRTKDWKVIENHPAS